MSTDTKMLEEQIIRDALLTEMPPAIREVCHNALTTNQLDCSKCIKKGKIFKYIIPFLQANPSIQTLDLSVPWHRRGEEISITSQHIIALIQNTNLLRLNISGHYGVTDLATIALAKSKSLQDLNADYTNIGDAGAQMLATSKSLQILSLFTTPITDVGAQALAKNKIFQHLLIKSDRVKFGDITINAFRDALLSGSNQSLTMLKVGGLKLTPELQAILQINSEREPLNACTIILGSLQPYLAKDLMSVVLAYCGRNIEDVQNMLPRQLSSCDSTVLHSQGRAQDYTEERKFHAEAMQTLPPTNETDAKPIIMSSAIPSVKDTEQPRRSLASNGKWAPPPPPFHLFSSLKK